MPALVIDCPDHGFVRDALAVRAVPNTLVIVDSMGRCPRCGRPAPYVDGSYRRRDGRESVELRLTSSQARRLRTALEWAQQQLESEAAEESEIRRRLDHVLDKEAPAWKPLVDGLLSSRTANVIQVLGFLLMLLTFLGLTPAGGGEDDAPAREPAMTEEMLRQLFDEYVGRDESGEEPPQPMPPPKTDV